MRWHRPWDVVLGVLLVSGAGQARAATQPSRDRYAVAEEPSEFEEHEDGRVRIRHGLELQGVLTGGLLPKLFGGADAAWTIGGDTFQLRLGASVITSGRFEVGAASVRNTVGFGFADLCAKRNAAVHRVRMCIGGEAGGWRHDWSPDDRGRAFTQHFAGTLKGDYRYAFTSRFGILIGVGVSVPVVGPIFHGVDHRGAVVPMVFPGPIAGTLRMGLSWGG